MTHSSDIQWNDEPETFYFLTSSFDVKAAKDIIRNRPREVHTMDISGVAGMVGFPPKEDGTQRIAVMGVAVNWKKALSEEVDLTIPVILCEAHGDHLPIDGWHRIAKAKALGIPSVLCVVLDKVESAKVSTLPKKVAQRKPSRRKTA